jgi:hypothetical protein
MTKYCDHHHPHFTGARETTSRSEDERGLQEFSMYTIKALMTGIQGCH